jgi:hypothetical protein
MGYLDHWINEEWPEKASNSYTRDKKHPQNVGSNTRRKELAEKTYEYLK